MFSIILKRLWGAIVSLLWFVGWIIWAYYIKPNLAIILLSAFGLLVAFIGLVYGSFHIIRGLYRMRKAKKDLEELMRKKDLENQHDEV
jgi:uncharacterized membrane protein (DUF485 family)